MYAVRDAITHKYNNNHLQRVIYTESTTRSPTGTRACRRRSGGRRRQLVLKKRSTLGAGIVFTSRDSHALHGPGIPRGRLFCRHRSARLEQGDELRWNHRPLCRSRRPAAEFQQQDGGLRGNNVNVHQSTTRTRSSPITAGKRRTADDVIVVANFSGTATAAKHRLPRSEPGKLRFQQRLERLRLGVRQLSLEQHDGEFRGEGRMSYNANVGVGPYTMVMLSQD